MDGWQYEREEFVDQRSEKEINDKGTNPKCWDKKTNGEPNSSIPGTRASMAVKLKKVKPKYKCEAKCKDSPSPIIESNTCIPEITCNKVAQNCSTPVGACLALDVQVYSRMFYLGFLGLVLTTDCLGLLSAQIKTGLSRTFDSTVRAKTGKATHD